MGEESEDGGEVVVWAVLVGGGESVSDYVLKGCWKRLVYGIAWD